jgi:NAD(P)-dependent dehydrogenase (short-subunit alcohol dehydrogenase family)
MVRTLNRQVWCASPPAAAAFDPEKGQIMGMLDNKTAVITGASQGIGLATARRFAAEGATVFITGRNHDRLHQAAAEIGPNAIAVPGDAYDLDDLDTLFTTISAAGRGLDIVMANAAVRSTAPLAEVTPEDFDTLYGANVRAVFFTVQKALPLLHDDASVILVGSAAAHRGQAGTSLYASSKATMHSFARIWTAELADRRIRVNVLTPGSVDTGSLERLATSPAAAAARRQTITAATPLGRMARPDEIASAALFLASNQSSFTTGTELITDGGITAS